MAERRMFTQKITESDAFLEMPCSTQNFYFHLCMNADDDGFVNSPKKIQRAIGATDDDAKILITKNFIIPFESGVIVIKHWRMHNQLRKDRYHPTDYYEEKCLLYLKPDGVYTLDEKKSKELLATKWQPNGNQMATEYSIGKDSIGKDSKEKNIQEKKVCEQTAPTKRFIKPTVEEINTYCKERRNGIDGQHFYDFYESKGWRIGKEPMKDWKACVRTWERRDGYQSETGGGNGFPQHANSFPRNELTEFYSENELKNFDDIEV